MVAILGRGSRPARLHPLPPQAAQALADEALGVDGGEGSAVAEAGAAAIGATEDGAAAAGTALIGDSSAGARSSSLLMLMADSSSE